MVLLLYLKQLRRELSVPCWHCFECQEQAVPEIDQALMSADLQRSPLSAEEAEAENGACPQPVL